MNEIMEVNSAKLAGLQIDMLQKIKAGHITEWHLEWFNNLKKSERDALSRDKKQAQAEKTFLLPLDSDFKKWGLNEERKPTEGMRIPVYEFAKDATLEPSIESIRADLDKLCFTQDRKKALEEKYTRILSLPCLASPLTFFFLKVENRFFIARARMISDSFYVYIYLLKNNAVDLVEAKERLRMFPLQPTV